ncbi:MAG: alpha-1,2-fucosyltransferase, partial [Mucilaginibacter sp.]
MALKNNTNLKLDISFFKNSTLRQYALDKFAISAQFASLNEFDLLKQKSYSRFNRLKKIFLNTSACYMREENIAFDPSYLNAGPNAALEGYWQCEDYFISSAGQIRKELEIKMGPSVDNAVLLSEIKTGNSISIHVRRGDYKSPGIVSIHGCCTMDYYNEAIKIMASRVDMPFFYIFS